MRRRARIEKPGNVPIRFEIQYDSWRIVENHRYIVRGRILVDGKLLFTTDQSYPVLTQGRGKEGVTAARTGGPEFRLWGVRHATRHPSLALPTSLNVSFVGRVGADILARLGGVAESSVSGMPFRERRTLPVLAEMGVPLEVGMGAIRFNLGRAQLKPRSTTSWNVSATSFA